MAGDPEECREQAKQCLELAKLAASPLAKAQFESLAQTWMRLAADIARLRGALEHWGSPGHHSRRDTWLRHRRAGNQFILLRPKPTCASASRMPSVSIHCHFLAASRTPGGSMPPEKACSWTLYR